MLQQYALPPPTKHTDTDTHAHTAPDIREVEAVQRKAARRVTKDYCYDERPRMASRLVMMYKITYDPVANPASEYLVRNTERNN